MDPEEEDAVVEAVMVVCYYCVDVGVFGFWREENLEWDVGIHYDEVAVEPAVVMEAISAKVVWAGEVDLHDPFQALCCWFCEFGEEDVENVCWF